MKFSIGTAYLQYLWLQLTRKPFALDTVDDAFDALYSFQSLTSLRLLRRMSVGVAIACLVWYVTETQESLTKRTVLTSDTGDFQCYHHSRPQLYRS
jgi:hypothetical protein